MSDPESDTTVKCVSCEAHGTFAATHYTPDVDEDRRRPGWTPPRGRTWIQLPPGWFMYIESEYDSYREVYACSPACADKLVEGERMHREYHEVREAAYADTRRGDENAVDKSAAAAERHMAKKYGPDWQTRMRNP